MENIPSGPVPYKFATTYADHYELLGEPPAPYPPDNDAAWCLNGSAAIALHNGGTRLYWFWVW